MMRPVEEEMIRKMQVKQKNVWTFELKLSLRMLFAADARMVLFINRNEFEAL